MTEWTGSDRYADYYGDDTELLPLSHVLSRQSDYPIPKTSYRFVDCSKLKEDEGDYRLVWIGHNPKICVFNADNTNMLHEDVVFYNWTDQYVQLYFWVDGEAKYRFSPGAEKDMQDTVAYQGVKHWFRISRGDAYYDRFGMEQVELHPDWENLRSVWDRIALRVNERFYNRFVAGETLEQWQMRLQVTTDRVGKRYERALNMYADRLSSMNTRVDAADTTVYSDVRDRGRTADTPDVSVNVDDGYAGTLSENVRDGEVTVRHDLPGGFVANLNKHIDLWRDLETELVEEYAECFLSTVWY